MASKIIKKTLEEAAGVQNAELDFSDKALISLEPDMSKLWGMKNITRLTPSQQVQQMVQTLVQTRVTHLLLEWNQKRVLETEKLCQRK